MKIEKWDDVHGNTTSDDRMVAFLESSTDSYAVLQLKHMEHYFDVTFNSPSDPIYTVFCGWMLLYCQGC